MAENFLTKPIHLKRPAFLDRTTEDLESKLDDDHILSHFDELIAARKLKEAQPVLAKIILADPLNIPLNALMHSLLIQNKDYEKLAIHTKKFLNILVEKGDYDTAAEIYYECRVLDEQCKPINPEQYYPLANALRKKHYYGTAISLLKGFHKKFPDNRFVPKVYFLVGQIYLRNLAEKRKAKQVLAFVMKNYPECKEINAIKLFYKETG